MAKITVFPPNTPRKTVLEQRIAEAEAYMEQYKHNALLHRLHTIHRDWLSKVLKEKLLYHNDRGGFIKHRKQLRKHLNKLTEDDATTNTHS